MFCREQVVQLHHVEDRISAAGVGMHVIGNGAPMFIAGFRATTGFDGAIYTDPDLAVYRALALRRGLGTVVRPSVAVAAVRALRGGFRQGRTQGDPWQQGGVALVGVDGRVRYKYVARAAGDHPAVAAVLAAL